MAGYNGYSMSNNAVAAYSNGEKPYSKWTKSAFNTEISNMIINGDLPEEIIPEIEKLKVTELKQFLVASSWHHTSCKYNRTMFYSIDADLILNHFGYISVVAGTAPNGQVVYGNFTGDRDQVTLRYKEFITISGERFLAEEITNRKIAYAKVN